MSDWIPYQHLVFRVSIPADQLLARIRWAFDSEEWVFKARADALFIRRRLGGQRMPGLPLARGRIRTGPSFTELDIRIRLSWPVMLFGCCWLAASTIVGVLGVSAVLRDGRPEALLTLILPVGGAAILFWPFPPEARAIRERLKTAVGKADSVISG